MKINEKRFYIWKNISVLAMLLLYLWLILLVRHDMVTNPDKYYYEIGESPPASMVKLESTLNKVAFISFIATGIIIIRWFIKLPPDSKIKKGIKMFQELDESKEDEDGKEDT